MVIFKIEVAEFRMNYLFVENKKELQFSLQLFHFNGGEYRNRTDDLLTASEFVSSSYELYPYFYFLLFEII